MIITRRRKSAPVKSAPKKIGRPRKEFDQAVANRICELIVKGQSLRRICLRKDLPSLSIAMKWLREEPDFQQQYARAREEQADGYADELIELARQATAENAQAIRVRADIIKWVCSKLKPRAYGDRVAVEADVAMREVVAPSDPRASWKTKTLVDWTAEEKIEAAKQLGFEIALMRRDLARAGFDPSIVEAMDRVGVVVIEAAQGRNAAVPPLALPYRGEMIDVTPTPEDEPVPPASPLDGIPWPMRAGVRELQDEATRPTASERRALEARTQRERAEIEATGRPWTAAERAQADEADEKDRRRADRTVAESRRPRVIGAGMSLSSARHRRGI